MDALKARLKVAKQLECNKRCSECNERAPSWAALIVLKNIKNNKKLGTDSSLLPKMLGVFCCYECSGSLRSLGVHICFVRSVTLDEWKEDEVLAMEHGGNERVNQAFEAKLGENKYLKPFPGAERTVRDLFLREKYAKQAYLDVQVLQQLQQDNLEKQQLDAEFDLFATKKSNTSFRNNATTSTTNNNNNNNADNNNTQNQTQIMSNMKPPAINTRLSFAVDFDAIAPFAGFAMDDNNDDKEKSINNENGDWWEGSTNKAPSAKKRHSIMNESKTLMVSKRELLGSGNKKKRDKERTFNGNASASSLHESFMDSFANDSFSDEENRNDATQSPKPPKRGLTRGYSVTVLSPTGSASKKLSPNAAAMLTGHTTTIELKPPAPSKLDGKKGGRAAPSKRQIRRCNSTQPAMETTKRSTIRRTSSGELVSASSLPTSQSRDLLKDGAIPRSRSREALEESTASAMPRSRSGDLRDGNRRNRKGRSAIPPPQNATEEEFEKWLADPPKVSTSSSSSSRRNRDSPGNDGLSKSEHGITASSSSRRRRSSSNDLSGSSSDHSAKESSSRRNSGNNRGGDSLSRSEHGKGSSGGGISSRRRRGADELSSRSDHNKESSRSRRPRSRTRDGKSRPRSRSVKKRSGGSSEKSSEKSSSGGLSPKLSNLSRKTNNERNVTRSVSPMPSNQTVMSLGVQSLPARTRTNSSDDDDGGGSGGNGKSSSRRKRVTPGAVSVH